MRKVIFGLICVAIIGLGCGFVVPRALGADDIYKGQVIFNTEEGYTNFKQELISSGAKWDGAEDRMDVLSSSPPIIVTFEVRVANDFHFPYGERSVERWGLLGLAIFGMLGGIFSTYMAMAMMEDDWGWIFQK